MLQKTRPCNVDVACGGEEAPQERYSNAIDYCNNDKRYNHIYISYI